MGGSEPLSLSPVFSLLAWKFLHWGPFLLWRWAYQTLQCTCEPGDHHPKKEGWVMLAALLTAAWLTLIGKLLTARLPRRMTFPEPLGVAGPHRASNTIRPTATSRTYWQDDGLLTFSQKTLTGEAIIWYRLISPSSIEIVRQVIVALTIPSIPPTGSQAGRAGSIPHPSRSRAQHSTEGGQEQEVTSLQHLLTKK